MSLKLKILNSVKKEQEKRWKRVKGKHSYMELHYYFSINSRLDYLFSKLFFLSLRKRIKETVRENYLTQQYNEAFINDETGFIEFENHWIQVSYLNSLIQEYIIKCEREIEANNLKLEL
jgi:hypothetical protein